MNSTLVSSENLIKAERWDFEYFSPEFLNTIQQINQSGWPVKKLKEIVITLTDGQHGYLEHTPTGIPLIRTTNVFENEIKLDDVRYIAPEVHNQIKRSQLKSGDVLLTTIGSIGVAAVVDNSIKEANINQNLVKITPNLDVNSFYLSIFLNSNLGKVQTQITASKSVVPIVNYPRLREMLVPLPPKPIQDRIAQIMQDAHNTYQNRLKEAEQLEANAKDYVLHTLGVNLSQIEDVKNFIIPSNNLIKQRFDVLYHTFHNLAFFDGFSKEFNLIPLGKIIEDDSYGILTPGDVYSDEHPITYIRVTDMRENMQIKFENSVKVPEEYYRHKRARLKKYDVILAIKGASIASKKSVAFVEDVLSKTIVNGTIFRFQVKKEHNPFYVAVMLDSEIVKGQIRKLQISNNAVAYVDKPSIYALLLPIPPRPLQDHIAQFIQNTYIQSKSLYVEAENLLTEAKVRVERMILGEEEVT